MKKNEKFSLIYFWLITLMIIFTQLLFFPDRPANVRLSYRDFLNALDSGKVARIVIFEDRIVGEFKSEDINEEQALTHAPTAPWRLRVPSIEKQVARQFIVSRIPELPDPELLAKLQASGVNFEGRYESNSLRNFFLNWVFPIIFFIGLWGVIFRRMGSSNPMLDFGRNKAKIYAEKPENQVKFSDVAGVDEAVEEVKEVVDFLKNPKKYTRLGGKLPKGLLLVGPPGTGKTLLARAVAGEAGVPFFNLSGSDFVEMFVGLGAARVRDLFKQAKAAAPCIIFIDEIDAIGKSRGNALTYGGGYDERENTLNQLLVEMDGFDPGVGVIIIGATNRPEVLDPALLRPGRFDRQVLVDRPDMKGREAIFKVHTRNLKLSSNVDLKQLAAQTPGFAGAEIANVCNEAALLAARNNRDEVTQSDFEAAIERLIAGLEKKNKIINEKERKIVAYHESGHAIVGYFTPGAEQVQKVSIVPRGIGALGYTLQMPLEDRYLMTKSEIIGKIKGLLGGRAAEEIVFNEISTGASNDLERVAQLVKNMIVVYGMSEKLPNYSLVNRSTPGFLNQSAGIERRSEHLERLIDEEVKEIIDKCYRETKEMLIEKRELLDKMANTLLEKEVLEKEEIEAILS
ncbi:MAG TPA: ATP-dependent zinc metalloprotease FtsH [Candidatus Marinimicrobia bacterium]|nr:ATP-dependent zinc metalloprotease FtsH [Candidatus Neomarinimicrobiota bacterium]HPB01028.1 ATP-dependent zinc metalloprotease FtsH [Candidatus Neomarinimicrobiota bacterium]HPY01424.1 ATP-dependent zinc metalloprotease FtsH [Candidatus Neomarinimicrobiota bacterium]HQO74675.1 ATP-dependent zinc metalloprotease FtsH [Candidatus Neomarinimicrobiota bacterium]